MAAAAATARPVHDAKSRACTGTVAYTFLASRELPLWPVWQHYFAGCPFGSFTVLVHTQQPGAARAQVESVGGAELPPAQTVNGSIRFNYQMVEAMLNVMAPQKHRLAQNGCAPHWVHIASDSCAPVAPCSAVHAKLRESTGASFVEHKAVYPDGVVKALQCEHRASAVLAAFSLYSAIVG